MTPRVPVRRRADGRWVARPYLGTDRVTGRQIRPQRTWPGDWDEGRAQAACDEWLAGLLPGASTGAARRLGSMLARYIDDPRHGFSGNTLATYRSALANYIEPTIGDVPYDELEPYMVTAAYRLLLTDGPARRAISRATLRKVHSLLSGAYREWQRVLRRNPMLDVAAPVPERAEPFALGDWDQGALASALAECMADEGTDRASVERRTTAFAAYIALQQGLRCGEACGLARRDWRRSAHDVHVGGTVVEKPGLMLKPDPKRGSAGNVAAAPEVERELARHIAWQDTWLDPVAPARAASVPLVTYRPDGRLARPSTVSRRFTALAREIGLPEGTTMHTLRHTHATWLIMHGYDMRTVQERLRHADVRTTLALYTSVAPGRDAEAAAAFARGF